MPTRPLSDELAQAAADAYRAHRRSWADASKALGIPRNTFAGRLRIAAERGMLLDEKPAMPGYRISRLADGPRGRTTEQKPEHGERFELPAGHVVKGVSALVDPDGREVVKWIKTNQDVEAHKVAMAAALEAFKEQIPAASPVPAPTHGNADLLNQFTVTDLHFGMLAWGEENARGDNYDLKIAEQLLLDWFTAAIDMAPNAATAVLAQLGDLLHHDSHLSVTPTHAHVLDADSRLQKMIRVVIRTMRRIVAMLLAKHDRVHIVMADANHDPAGGAWLREMFAAFFEDEPRVSVDSSASTYYVFEHGETSLFYHHGHKRGVDKVDTVFAGQFRDVFGRTRFSYAHTGHKHADELKTTNLMKVEQHETLSAPDAFAALGGWLSGRSAKVITYHKRFGEVSRIILSPEMVAGALGAQESVDNKHDGG